MTLIERYIHEVGRQLPAKNRSDIQIELRSSLEDALESKVTGEPGEADVVALLKEFGTPREVAASYYPEGQYLVGPALYPLFRMIIGVVLAAVIGAQLIAWIVSAFVAQDPVDPVRAALGLVNSLPTALGMVVIVFMLLQRLDVRPDLVKSEWDPRDLPQIEAQETVKRGERIASIIMAIIFLILLLVFQERIGFVFSFGWQTFTNPVIGQYILWISLSLLLGIGLDIYLLWKGRWDIAGRVMKIGANLFSSVILFLLVRGHNEWLAQNGVGGLFDALARLPQDLVEGGQLVGMEVFRMAFTIALIVILIETLVMVVRFAARLVAGSIKQEPVTFHLK